jgi:YHS domain-containing protein
MKTILCTFALTMLTVVGTQAQVVEPVDKHKIANGGYDVVAYFTDQAPAKGKAEYTHEVNGIKYQFASAEHRALFAQSPERYLPVCDGYCAWGVDEKGKKVPVDPRTFKVSCICSSMAISTAAPLTHCPNGTRTNSNC